MSIATVTVIVPHFKRRSTGVTSTVGALLPVQRSTLPIAALGYGLPEGMPSVSAWQLLLAWRRPNDHPFRIWHARRQNEMLVGCILKYVLRQPWRLVFTAANARPLSGITRFAIDRMDALIATSNAVATALDKPATVVVHGVDTERFRPAEDRAAEWAASGLPGRFGIGILGRVRPQKGTDLFVDAMIDLLPRHPDWTAAVIGRAKPADGAFRDGLIRRVTDAGLSNRIWFLGERPAEEIPTWFRRLSVVVAPARQEGFGLTPLEAMASATPAVTSEAGAFRRTVVDGETGIVTPTGDLASLVGAIDRLMGDDAKRETMGLSARRHAVARAGIEAEAGGINAVYERLWSVEPGTGAHARPPT